MSDQKLKIRLAPAKGSVALPPHAYSKEAAPFVGKGLDKVARSGGLGDQVCACWFEVEVDCGLLGSKVQFKHRLRRVAENWAGSCPLPCTVREVGLGCTCKPCAEAKRLEQEALAVLASRSLIYRGDGLREDSAAAKRRLEAANTKALLAEQERARIAREGMLAARTRVLKPGCRVDPGVAKVTSTFRGVEALRDMSGLEKQGRWE